MFKLNISQRIRLNKGFPGLCIAFRFRFEQASRVTRLSLNASINDMLSNGEDALAEANSTNV